MVTLAFVVQAAFLHSTAGAYTCGLYLKINTRLKLRRTSLMMGVLLLLFVAAILLVQHNAPKENGPANQANSFVGEQQCKTCHAKEYNEWRASDHFKAMQEANDTTVLGDFNNQTLTADGVTSRFFKKGNKFFIHTEAADGQYQDYEIAYTFGHWPLQQYLVRFAGGSMQVARQSWDSKSKKWFHQYAGQKIAAGDWLHWTGNAQNWNTTCARCHSTNLKKNYDFESDTYHTTYDNITVSCESCHGAGKRHIDYVNSAAFKKNKKIPGAYISLAAGASQLAQINTCTPCHSRAAEVAPDLAQTGELLDDYIPEIPSTEYFYADGQVKDEDYTYSSFLQSKMYHRGVKCSNCHNAHTGKILFAANQLCMQCHSKQYDDVAHTHHVKGTTAAACKSCHMPATYYMGNDLRHDHAFGVPRPDLSAKYGTPNACNKCHTNKPATWAADAVSKWFGTNRAPSFAEDLILASKADARSEASVVRLVSDSATPAIIKATALHYVKEIASPSSVPTLLKGLQHPDAQVRYRALLSLGSFPYSQWLNDAAPLLADKVRAVRIAAADLFITVPQARIPSNYDNDFIQAKGELERFVLFQTDFASGNVLAGDYYLKVEDYGRAERFYVRGLQKDTAMNYARLNLSVVYNLTGRNMQALKVLQQALEVDAANDRIYFNMALLYNELRDVKNAAQCLQKAVALKTENPRVYYNYGLLLQQNAKPDEAAAMFQKGIRLAPTDADLHYALCILYLQMNKIEQAKKAALVLKKHHGGIADYKPLFRQLGI